MNERQHDFVLCFCFIKTNSIHTNLKTCSVCVRARLCEWEEFIELH